MTIPEQAVQAETLWAVNIQGPDDLIAAPDYLSAVRMSNAFNAWWLNLKMKQPHNDAIDARMWAAPTDWPENYAQAHADELSKPHPEYQWLRDASAAPHLAAVRVNVDEIVQPLEDIHAPGGLCRWTDVATAIGEVRRALSALQPSPRDELMKQIREGTAYGFLNDGSQPEGNPDLDCPYCCGSGHKGDIEPSAGRAAVLEEAARLVETHAYTVSNAGPRLEPSKMAKDDQHHATIAAAIRALTYQQPDKLADRSENEPGAQREPALHPVADKPDEAGAQGEGWLPMKHPDTPRDGTEILAWRKDCGQFIASYTSCSAFPMSEAELDLLDEETLFKEDWFTQWPQALRLEGSEVPTRWRHLPTPPSGEVA